MFLDSDFPFRRLDKKIYSEEEKRNVCSEINVNANNVVFYAIFCLSFPYAFSAQKSKHKNYKHTIQNILFKTQCHIQASVEKKSQNQRINSNAFFFFFFFSNFFFSQF